MYVCMHVCVDELYGDVPLPGSKEWNLMRGDYFDTEQKMESYEGL